jgi:hypothetical protein
MKCTTPTPATSSARSFVRRSPESVVTGVMLVALGGDDKVLPTLIAGVEQRLAQARLAPIKPEGRA